MDTANMKEFVCLAQVRNYQRAADRLFISQPSLSKHISQLESELGGPLIDRSRRGVELTPLGQAFYEYAEQIVNQEESFLAAAARFLTPDPDRHLTIGIPLSAESWNITSFCIEFNRHYPDCRIDFVSSVPNPRQQNRQLLSHEVSFWFRLARQNAIAHDGTQLMRYYPTHFVAVVNRQHRLASQEYVTCGDLSGERIISAEKESISAQLLAEAFRREGHVFTQDMMVSTISTMYEYVRETNSVAVMPATPRKRKDAENYVFLDIRPQINVSMDLVYAEPETGAEKAFLEYCDGALPFRQLP